MAYRTFESSSKWDAESACSDSEAEIVGYYSVDGDCNYLPNSSRLLYYKSPRKKIVHWDLNLGMESAVRKTATHDNLVMRHLLEWIKLNRAKIECPIQSHKWIKPDFVSTRGEFCRLLATKYKPQHGWIIYAVKWKGTIYLDADRGKIYDVVFHDSTKYASRVFKLEKHIVSDAPDKDPDPSKPIIETDEFRCVHQRRFGDHTILYTAKIHGVCSDRPLKDPLPIDELKFVEIKTYSLIKHAGHNLFFRKVKLLEWWCQCFLGNAEAVLCGFKDESGIVHNLETYKISEIIDMAQDYWSPASCIDHFKVLLSKISEAVSDDCETTIYKFEKKPNVDDIYATKLSPSPELNILPSSFLEATR